VFTKCVIVVLLRFSRTTPGGIVTVTGETSKPETYPFGPVNGLDIHPRYFEALEQPGLVPIRMPYGEGFAWLVTRYPDVKAVLTDHRRFSRAQAAGRDETPRARPHPDPPDMLISKDPPDHTRLRGLVTKAFTPRRVQQMRPGIEDIVNHLLDDMVTVGRPADLAETLAWPLPVKVICELLGVPDSDHGQFRRWTELTLSLGGNSKPEESKAARNNLDNYLAELIGRRREEPADDLLSDLAAVRDDGGGRLTETEMVKLATTLLISGHETTAAQIGNGVFVLLSQGRWEELVSGGPAVVPDAVEELLRWIPLGASVDFARRATEDTELGGQTVQAGDVLLVDYYVANRDPAAFADPDRLDLTRENAASHLTFGHGLHHCLGAQLARMELQVAMTALLNRFPALRLAVDPEQVQWHTDRLIRGVKVLPVAW
jgi:cytochrome P450